MRLGEPVQRILFEGRSARGVEAGGIERHYDAVVLNAGFAHAMQRLVPNALRRRWTDRKIESKRFSCSTFMLYLGVEGTLPDIAHHTVFLAGDYKRNVAEIEPATMPPTAPSFYVQNACVTDRGLAPPRQLDIVCAGSGRPQPSGRHRLGRACASLSRPDATTAGADRHYAPGPSHCLRKDADAGRLGARHAIYRGATFNLAHNLGQMLHMRPRNRFEIWMASIWPAAGRIPAADCR